ncbi:hypothetical protein EDB92DRAFT_1934676 [Lactarius akahatsu]|uniref:Uncharacterized protein n=1 Tax=Lactarius akahatsu TaxID=416441 RepID=A0AAD4LI67_9AGAM|nr:hypothetical protein EDB92DRAFT_1934676 [Lactarius akahatsu]
MMTMMKHPELPSSESLSFFPHLYHTYHFAAPVYQLLGIASDAAAVTPYDISEWEKTTYYHGISLDHPQVELLYRSNLLQNPFPIPKGRHRHLPIKTVYGFFNTPLNAVWDIVAPQICDLSIERKIRRFVTHGEDGKDTLGPIVIWIATHPTTTTAENADNGVEGAVVEWYEGAIEKLSGPPLLRVTGKTNPTHYVRRSLTAVLGMPIAIAEREAADAQGSVTLFFHENRGKDGNPSAKVFAVSNCHVLREDTTVAYEFRGPGAPHQYVRVVGFRRFQLGLDEIKALIGGYGTDADLLAREIGELEAKPESEDPVQAAEDKAGVEANRNKLAKEILGQLGNIMRRNIGCVHWVPEISVDVQGRKYTKDIGTFELDGAKYRENFQGNVVDLGVKFTPRKLTDMFYPQSGGRTVFKFPTNRQLRINGWVMRELLADPDCFDMNGKPCPVVMKDDNTTGLTVGRYSGLEAYELGTESVELIIYNCDKSSGPFSAKGDSGSLIFDGTGKMVGILRSVMEKGGSSHVTYATPTWWAIDQLKLRYPYADFNRVDF